MAFIDSLKASARSLRNACNSSKRHADGAAAQTTAAASAQESAALKDAAEQARSEVERKAKEVPATYLLRSALPGAPTSPTFVGDWDLSKPCVFPKDSVEELQPLRDDPVVKLMVASFGGPHKMTQAFIDTKMYTCPAYAGKGLEPINTWINNAALEPGTLN